MIVIQANKTDKSKLGNACIAVDSENFAYVQFVKMVTYISNAKTIPM